MKFRRYPDIKGSTIFFFWTFSNFSTKIQISVYACMKCFFKLINIFGMKI